MVVRFENISSINYYIEFDNWTQERKDELSFYIRTSCKRDTDSLNLNLAYITSSTLYLESGKLDTVALKCHFREVRTYIDECTDKHSEEEIKQQLKLNTVFHYNMKSDFTDIVKNDKVYHPITKLKKAILK